MHRGLHVFATAVAVAAAAPALAQQETTTYTYDALGRLTGSTYQGGPNNNTNVAIQYDAAGNRTNYAVTGAVNAQPASSTRVIVVPLNGFTLIPISN